MISTTRWTWKPVLQWHSFRDWELWWFNLVLKVGREAS
jgi:hypothetical protein